MNAWLIAHGSWTIPVLATAIVAVLLALAWMLVAVVTRSTR